MYRGLARILQRCDPTRVQSKAVLEGLRFWLGKVKEECHPAWLGQQRGLKLVGIKNPEIYHAEKVKHQEAMKELRKAWAKDRDEKARLKAEARVQHEARRAEQTKELRKQRNRRKRKAQARRKSLVATEAEAKAVRLQKAAEWRQAVAFCYGKVNAQRKEYLLHASKDWITPENLDMRIDEALQSEAKLYEYTPAPGNYSERQRSKQGAAANNISPKIATVSVELI